MKIILFVFGIICFFITAQASACYCGGIFPPDNQPVKPLAEAGIPAESIESFVAENYVAPIVKDEQIAIELRNYPSDLSRRVTVGWEAPLCDKLDLYVFKTVWQIPTSVPPVFPKGGRDEYLQVPVVKKLAGYDFQVGVNKIGMNYTDIPKNASLFAVLRCDHQYFQSPTVLVEDTSSCGMFGRFYAEHTDDVDELNAQAIKQWNELMDMQGVPDCGVEP